MGGMANQSKLEDRQHGVVRQEMLRRAEKAARKTSFHHIWVIEEFLETYINWGFCPNETPHRTRASAEGRLLELKQEYPWALFRISYGSVQPHPLLRSRRMTSTVKGKEGHDDLPRS
jgi:hypothetical protein